jgi:hypothetical protein
MLSTPGQWFAGMRVEENGNESRTEANVGNERLWNILATPRVAVLKLRTNK